MRRRQEILLMVLLFIVGVVGLITLYAGGSIVLATHDEAPDVSWGADIRSASTAGNLALDRDADALYDQDHEAYRNANASRYFYPPWYAVLMIPLSTIPFPAVFFLWSVAGIALLLMSIRVLEIEAAALVFVAALATWASLAGVWYGQSSFLMLALLALGIRFTLSGRHVSGGIAMALSAFKPHLLLGFVVLWLADVRRWKTLLASAAGTTVALVAVSELWIPGAWWQFFGRLFDSGELAAPDSSVSLLAAFRLLLPSAGSWVWAVWGFVAAAVVASFSATIRTWQGNDGVVVALAIVVSLLLPLHGLPYDWVLLVATFGLLYRYAGISQGTAALPFLALGALLPMGMLMTDRMLDRLGWAIHTPPLLLLAIYAWLTVEFARGRNDASSLNGVNQLPS